MKKSLLTILLLIFILSAIGQKHNGLLMPPKVDKRVELLSIVFRLAGNNEYNMDDYESYVNDIHLHFDKYKNHPLIKFAKLLRRKNQVSYDAVMSMAVSFEQPPSLKPLVSFNDSIPEPRWGAKNGYKFVSLLQQFYVDANCEEFFKVHEPLYLKAEERFKVIYDSLDISWYKDFFGKDPDENFNIVLGLGNGGGSYGPHINYKDKKNDVYAIVGTWNFDSIGIPVYAKNYLPLLIHEFNHSFVNQLINKNLTPLEASGKILFKEVKSKMKSQAYSCWETMIIESLVRSSTIMYMKKHENKKNNVARLMGYELSNGFLWMKEMVDLLDQFEKERNTYPTLESFMPQIISFFQKSASNIQTLKENYEINTPHVASIQQFENNAKNVDPSLTEIKIIFDRPLLGKGYSFYYGDKGKNSFPITDIIGYSDDNKAISIKVLLKPNKKYQFILNGNGFYTNDGYLLEEYEVNFKTRK